MRLTGKERLELKNQLERLRMDVYLDGYKGSIGMVLDFVQGEIVLMDRSEDGIGRHAWPSGAEAIAGLRELRKKHGTRSGGL